MHAISKASYNHIRNIGSISRYIRKIVPTKSLAHALMTSARDYGSAVLYSKQNSAARPVTHTRKRQLDLPALASSNIQVEVQNPGVCL